MLIHWFLFLNDRSGFTNSSSEIKKYIARQASLILVDDIKTLHHELRGLRNELLSKNRAIMDMKKWLLQKEHEIEYKNFRISRMEALDFDSRIQKSKQNIIETIVLHSDDE